MKVLVGCERFGVVRDAFRRLGHDAYSCDLVPMADGTYHITNNVLNVLDRGWDLAIFHPDCTYVAVSGLHWNKRRPERAALTEQALDFVRRLMACQIPKWAIENPIGCISTRIRKPDQVIQPWQYGEDASKATCLWLKGLPPPWRRRTCFRVAERLAVRTRPPAARTSSGRLQSGQCCERRRIRGSQTRWPCSGAGTLGNLLRRR